MSRPRFLVTGAQGQVGFELQRSLSLSGEVVALTREDLDLSQPDQIRSVMQRVQPTVVINPAAYTAVDAAEQDRARATQVNVDAVSVLARCAREQGAALVHFSTDYVFDGSGDQPRDESAPTRPLNVYGETKRAGEVAIQSVFAGSEIPYFILRTSWVYGCVGNNFLKTMLRLAAERDTLRVVADQIGAPTSAALLADLTALLLAKQPASGLYHAVAAGETSWQGFAQHILRRAAAQGYLLKVNPEAVAPLTTAEYPTPAQRPLNSRLDTRKLSTALGITLPHWTVGVNQVTDVLTQRLRHA